MNECINDEAVCRTAPATPGLLNMSVKIYKTKEAKQIYFNVIICDRNLLFIRPPNCITLSACLR